MHCRRVNVSRFSSIFVLLLTVFCSINTAGAKDFVFYVWSDTHFGACNKPVRLEVMEQMNELVGKKYPQYYSKTLTVEKPSFLLHLGDITESGTARQWYDPNNQPYSSYVQTIKFLAATKKTYEVVGNHDAKKNCVVPVLS